MNTHTEELDKPIEGPKSEGSKLTRKILTRKISPKAVWIAAAVIVLAALLGLAYNFKALFVAATVDGHPISRLAVVRELEKQGGKDVLDTLINKQLIQKEVGAKGITVKQDEVDQEMKKYEDQFNVNGHTLDDSLAAQNLTRDDLKEQIIIQKEIQQLLGDKVNVSDQELDSYIKDNNIALPADGKDAARAQVKDQLQQQKLADESTQYISDLRAKAKVKRFVSY